MKTIGLIGGTSWRATQEYYKQINQQITSHYGDERNPPMQITSINQDEILQLVKNNHWEKVEQIYLRHSRDMERTGVEAIAFCAHSPHRFIPRIKQLVSVPFLHIADGVGEVIQRNGWKNVSLIGTKFCMEQDFIKGTLEEKYRARVNIPTAAEREKIQELFYSDLSRGVFQPDTRDFFVDVVQSLINNGTSAVIVGCSDFRILLQNTRFNVPLIDSLECHCQQISQFIRS